MSDTVKINVPQDVWTNISLAEANGLFTNNRRSVVRYRQATSEPDADSNFGHTLNPGESSYFYLPGGETLWAKGITEDGVVAVTGGMALSKDGYFAKDFLAEVNFGNVPGYKLVHKFGSNSDVGTTKEDVWEQGGDIPWMIAAETLEVVSSDTTNDISTGDGARSVKITGLDDDFNEIVETIALAATPVTTTNLFRRILTLEVGGVGTYTGANQGDITITGTTSSNVHGKILADEGRSSQTQYTIPANKTGYIIRLSITVETGKTLNINLHNREGADIVVAPFTPSLHLHHWDGLDSPVEERFLANHRLEEKTDIWFDASVPLTSGGVDIDYDLLIVDN